MNLVDQLTIENVQAEIDRLDAEMQGLSERIVQARGESFRLKAVMEVLGKPISPIPENGASIGPTQAVLNVLMQNPERWFKSREIIGRLKALQDDGLLRSNAIQISSAAHTALREMISSKRIEKVGCKNNAQYHLIQQESQ